MIVQSTPTAMPILIQQFLALLKILNAYSLRFAIIWMQYSGNTHLQLFDTSGVIYGNYYI